MRGDLTEEVQDIRLMTTVLVPTGKRQRSLGEDTRLLQVTGQ
jgi:hypothetical protein